MVIVSISDVLDCAGVYKRPLVEGEAILESKLLVLVGRLPADDDDVNTLRIVKALCLQTSSIHAFPHTIEVHLDLDVVVERVKKIVCSCKAGESAKCKHAVATLMYLNKLRNYEDLDELSCTDLEQEWGKLKTSVKTDFEAVTTSEYCHVRKESVPIYSRGIPDVSDELAEIFATAIRKVDKKCESFIHTSLLRAEASKKNCIKKVDGVLSAEEKEAAAFLASKILNGDPVLSCLSRLCQETEDKLKSLPVDVVQFYEEFVKVDIEKSLYIASESVNQCGKIWFDERGKRITGSKCYNLFTYACNKNPDWEKKLTSTFKSSFSGNEATVYGLQCEPLAKEKYISKKQADVSQSGLIVNPSLPWLGCSPDGIVLDQSDKPTTLLEVKSILGKNTPASMLSKVAKCIDKTGTLKKRHNYYGQIQLGMLLCNLQKCDLVLYSSFDEDIAVETIPFDETFVYRMISSLTDVYFDEILPWLMKQEGGRNPST